MKKTAICFNTHVWNDIIDKIFHKMVDDLQYRKDVDIWVLYDITDKDKDKEAETINYDLDYVHFVDMYDKWEEPYFYACEHQIKIWKADNGNMLFYDFVEKHQEYEYYIFHENDIMYNGNYNMILDNIPYKKYDIMFQKCEMSINGMEKWVHYNYMNIPNFKKDEIFQCLQQVFYVKRTAINKILKLMKEFDPEQFNCFYEITIPTFAHKLKLKIGNIQTYMSVIAYPKLKSAEKQFEICKHDMPNTWIHPVKDVKLYDFIKLNTTDIGSSKRF